MRELLGKLAVADYKKYWCSTYVREAQGSSRQEHRWEILVTLLFHSDVTGLVEVLVGWLATLPKSQPVGAFYGLQLAGYRKSCLTG